MANAGTLQSPTSLEMADSAAACSTQAGLGPQGTLQHISTFHQHIKCCCLPGNAASSPQGPHADGAPARSNPHNGHHCNCLLARCTPQPHADTLLHLAVPNGVVTVIACYGGAALSSCGAHAEIPLHASGAPKQVITASASGQPQAFRSHTSMPLLHLAVAH